MKEGRKPEYPEKTSSDKLQKMPHTKAQRFKPQARLKPTQQLWWQARKTDVLTVTPLSLNLRIHIYSITFPLSLCCTSAKLTHCCGFNEKGLITLLHYFPTSILILGMGRKGLNTSHITGDLKRWQRVSEEREKINKKQNV